MMLISSCNDITRRYFGTQKLSLKSDVFSFGVVILELLTGRLPIDKTRPNREEWNICDYVSHPLYITHSLLYFTYFGCISVMQIMSCWERETIFAGAWHPGIRRKYRQDFGPCRESFPSEAGITVESCRGCAAERGTEGRASAQHGGSDRRASCRHRHRRLPRWILTSSPGWV